MDLKLKLPKCKFCKGSKVVKSGYKPNKKPIYLCKKCNRHFSVDDFRKNNSRNKKYSKELVEEMKNLNKKIYFRHIKDTIVGTIILDDNEVDYNKYTPHIISKKRRYNLIIKFLVKKYGKNKELPPYEYFVENYKK